MGDDKQTQNPDERDRAREEQKITPIARITRAYAAEASRREQTKETETP